MDNICHFIPYHKDYHSIHTINFVLETKPQTPDLVKTQSVYKIHLVCGGKGLLHMAGKTIALSNGDIFFTFPSIEYSIESIESFSFMYISFLGPRSIMIMDSLNISSKNFIFKDCQEIYDFWNKGLGANPEVTDLISESILLYSFAFLESRYLTFDIKNQSVDDAALLVKKYIDDHFSQSKLSLDELSNNLSYSPKYISSVFKKKFNIGITEYLNTIRIQRACTLMRQRHTNVTYIAGICGYSDSLYFSKVFKRIVGVSPKNYIVAAKNNS